MIVSVYSCHSMHCAAHKPAWKRRQKSSSFEDVKPTHKKRPDGPPVDTFFARQIFSGKEWSFALSFDSVQTYYTGSENGDDDGGFRGRGLRAVDDGDAGLPGLSRRPNPLVQMAFRRLWR